MFRFTYTFKTLLYLLPLLSSSEVIANKRILSEEDLHQKFQAYKELLYGENNDRSPKDEEQKKQGRITEAEKEFRDSILEEQRNSGEEKQRELAIKLEDPKEKKAETTEGLIGIAARDMRILEHEYEKIPVALFDANNRYVQMAYQKGLQLRSATEIFLNDTNRGSEKRMLLMEYLSNVAIPMRDMIVALRSNIEIENDGSTLYQDLLPVLPKSMVNRHLQADIRKLLENEMLYGHGNENRPFVEIHNDRSLRFREGEMTLRDVAAFKHVPSATNYILALKFVTMNTMVEQLGFFKVIANSFRKTEEGPREEYFALDDEVVKACHKYENHFIPRKLKLDQVLGEDRSYTEIIEKLEIISDHQIFKDDAQLDDIDWNPAKSAPPRASVTETLLAAQAFLTLESHDEAVIPLFIDTVSSWFWEDSSVFAYQHFDRYKFPLANKGLNRLVQIDDWMYYDEVSEKLRERIKPSFTNFPSFWMWQLGLQFVQWLLPKRLEFDHNLLLGEEIVKEIFTIEKANKEKDIYGLQRPQYKDSEIIQSFKKLYKAESLEELLKHFPELKSKVEAETKGNQIAIRMPPLFGAPELRSWALRRLAVFTYENLKTNDLTITSAFAKACLPIQKNFAAYKEKRRRQVSDNFGRVTFSETPPPSSHLLQLCDGENASEIMALFAAKLKRFVGMGTYFPADTSFTLQERESYVLFSKVWDHLLSSPKFSEAQVEGDHLIRDPYELLIAEVERKNPMAQVKLGSLLLLQYVDMEIKSPVVSKARRLELRHFRKVLVDALARTRIAGNPYRPFYAEEILSDDQRKELWRSYFEEFSFSATGNPLPGTLVKTVDTTTKRNYDIFQDLFALNFRLTGSDDDPRNRFFNFLGLIDSIPLYTDNNAEEFLARFEGIPYADFGEAEARVQDIFQQSDVYEYSDLMLEMFALPIELKEENDKQEIDLSEHQRIYQKILERYFELHKMDPVQYPLDEAELGPRLLKKTLAKMHNIRRREYAAELFRAASQLRIEQIQKSLAQLCQQNLDRQEELKTTFFATMNMQNAVNKVLGYPSIPPYVMEKAEDLTPSEAMEMTLAIPFMLSYMGASVIAPKLLRGPFSRLGNVVVGGLFGVSLPVQVTFFLGEWGRYHNGQDRKEIVAAMEELGLSKPGARYEVDGNIILPIIELISFWSIINVMRENIATLLDNIANQANGRLKGISRNKAMQNSNDHFGRLEALRTLRGDGITNLNLGIKNAQLDFLRFMKDAGLTFKTEGPLRGLAFVVLKTAESAWELPFVSPFLWPAEAILRGLKEGVVAMMKEITPATFQNRSEYWRKVQSAVPRASQKFVSTFNKALKETRSKYALKRIEMEIPSQDELVSMTISRLAGEVDDSLPNMLGFLEHHAERFKKAYVKDQKIIEEQKKRPWWKKIFRYNAITSAPHQFWTSDMIRHYDEFMDLLKDMQKASKEGNISVSTFFQKKFEERQEVFDRAIDALVAPAMEGRNAYWMILMQGGPHVRSVFTSWSNQLFYFRNVGISYQKLSMDKMRFNTFKKIGIKDDIEALRNIEVVRSLRAMLLTDEVIFDPPLPLTSLGRWGQLENMARKRGDLEKAISGALYEVAANKGPISKLKNKLSELTGVKLDPSHFTDYVRNVEAQGATSLVRWRRQRAIEALVREMDADKFVLALAKKLGHQELQELSELLLSRTRELNKMGEDQTISQRLRILAMHKLATVLSRQRIDLDNK